MKPTSDSQASPLLVPALALAAGILVSASGAATWRLWIIPVILSPLWMTVGSRTVSAAFFAAGLLVGFASVSQVHDAHAPASSVTVRGCVSRSAWTQTGTAISLRTESGPVRIYVKEHVDIPADAEVFAFGRERAASAGRNPGQPCRPSERWFDVKSPAGLFVLDTSNTIRATFDRIRTTFRRKIDATFTGEERGLARALILGDRSGLSDACRDNVRRLGVSHLLAISGMHVGILAALLVLVARTAFPRGATWRWVVVGALVAYAPVAGAGGSVIRAVLMGGAAVWVLGSGRRVDALNLLCASFILTAALSPGVLGSVGYVLSYVATAGILVYARRPSWPAPRRVALAFDAVGVSLAATWATLPVVAHVFGTVRLGGILYSAPGGLLVTAALIPLFAGLVTAPIAFVGDGFLLAAWPALRTLAWLSRQPLPGPGWPADGVHACVAMVTMAAVAACFFGRRGRHVAAVLAGIAVVSPAPRSSGVPEVVLLDVGSGDAIVVSLPDGTGYLIDTGRPAHAFRVEGALRALRVRRPIAIVTHGDEDHDGGIPALLRARALSGLVVSAIDSSRVEERYGDVTVPLKAPARGDTLWASARGALVCEHPARSDDDLVHDNARSLVLVLTWDDWRVVLTGDVEEDGLARWQTRTSPASGDVRTILKLGHHGSPASTPDSLLTRLNPTLALVSTSKVLPRETMSRLMARSVPVWSTATNGAIRLRLLETGAEVSVWRCGWRRVAGDVPTSLARDPSL